MLYVPDGYQPIGHYLDSIFLEPNTVIRNKLTNSIHCSMASLIKTDSSLLQSNLNLFGTTYKAFIGFSPRGPA